MQELCIEVTNRCLQNCVHCSSRSNPRGREAIRPSIYARVLKDFVALGGKVLELSGGEPLLHPDLLALVKLAKDLLLEVKIYTSGIASTGNHGFLPISDQNLVALKSSGCDKLIFGLQGSDSRTHERITQTLGSFAATIASIKKAKAHGFWVGLHFVPMKPNFACLGDVISLSQELCVDEIAVLRFVPQGRGRTNGAKLSLIQGEFGQLLQKLNTASLQLKSRGQLRIGCPLNFYSLLYGKTSVSDCKAGRATCLISSEGDILPCAAFKDLPAYVAGNLNQESFLQVFNNHETWRQLRGFDATEIRGVCSSCAELIRCNGGCAAQRILSHGNLNHGPDPQCSQIRVSAEMANQTLL